jgi:K+ transporter
VLTPPASTVVYGDIGTSPLYVMNGIFPSVRT